MMPRFTLGAWCFIGAWIWGFGASRAFRSARVSQLPKRNHSSNVPRVAASRRIVTYWLLLLVPTLLVGAGAMLLLRREQARIAEQSAEAQASRQAAVVSRARLVAENVELLVGDVQNGLLDALVSEPAATLDEFLAAWERSQPLVRTTFRATLDGRLLRPAAREGSEESRGFVRRFARVLQESPPWGASAQREAERMEGAKDKRLEDEARKAVTQNVVQLQSARRDVQELLKTPAAAAGAPMAESAASSDSLSRSRTAAEYKAEADGTIAGVSRAPAASGSRAQQVAGSDTPARAAKPVAAKISTPVPDRRGWIPHSVDGRLHLLGWVIPSGASDVRGVEVELAALISRLAGALPAEVASREGYALRGDSGRVLHQVGAVPLQGVPSTIVPLAAAVLPGWQVAGYLGPMPYGEGGSGFLWVSALLVGLFIAAILAGGSLLLWQARRSEAEAAQKTSFVANVSHEFKTPLTTIRLYAELLEQRRVRDEAQGAEYLRTIGRETQRLARLVNNALDFSRLEQGRKRYAPEKLDLGKELGALLDSQSPRLAEAGLALHRELPAVPVISMTDRDALEQIVLNLLDNACKYAAAGGEITVAVAARQGGGAEVRVADRGPGVPAEHRERIFEKFHRVDDALTAEKTGAGLGLSIARQLARGLGGELRCMAREGGGAEFVLELP